MYVEQLKEEVSRLQAENVRLKALLSQHGISTQQPETCVCNPSSDTADAAASGLAPFDPASAKGPSCPLQGPSAHLAMSHSLSKQQVERYSRQLLLPSFGLAAQERLCKGSVLIIGCGGLGSPAALYLAAAGVGRIGLVDHDTVDLSNLHRQVIHAEDRVGVHKAESAAQTCRALNSLIKVEVHTGGFTPQNAVSLVQQYDVVLDASDNPPTRYLISDACVVAGKPLVSAAAVGTDGQLTVYNYGEDGPCYRCLFPESPQPENCSRCADAGVLGPVPGVMGVLQAVEVCKILGGVGSVMSRKLLLFDSLAGRFTTVKLRDKRAECAARGSNPTITLDNIASYDYQAFTGQAATDGPLPPLKLVQESDRLTVQQFQDLLERSQAAKQPLQVLDVRPGPQVAVLTVPSAMHVPFEKVEARMDDILGMAAQASSSAGAEHAEQAGSSYPNLVVLCRRGNNSQKVITQLRKRGVQNVVDVIGGVDEWVKQLLPHSMPVL